MITDDKNDSTTAQPAAEQEPLAPEGTAPKFPPGSYGDGSSYGGLNYGDATREDRR